MNQKTIRAKDKKLQIPTPASALAAKRRRSNEIHSK